MIFFFFNAREAQGKITKHRGSGDREEGQRDFREGFWEEKPSQLDQLEEEEGTSGPSRPSTVWSMPLSHCVSIGEVYHSGSEGDKQ